MKTIIIGIAVQSESKATSLKFSLSSIFNLIRNLFSKLFNVKVLENENRDKKPELQGNPKLSMVRIKVASTTEDPPVLHIEIDYEGVMLDFSTLIINSFDLIVADPIMINDQDWNSYHEPEKLIFRPKPGTNITTNFPVKTNAGEVILQNAINDAILQQKVPVEVFEEV